MILRVLVQPFLRQHRQDDVFHHRFAQQLVADVGIVLGGQHHRLDADDLVALIAEGDLALGVGPQPGQHAALAHLGLPLHQPMGVGDGGGHQHVGFVAGVAEHQALVASALLLRAIAVHALGDVRRLLADAGQYGAGRAVEADMGVVVADADHGIAHDLVEIHPRRRGDFASQDDDAGLDQGFAGDAGLGVFSNNGVQHGIGNLVGDFIRMPFGNGFRGEQIGAAHGMAYPQKQVAAGKIPCAKTATVMQRSQVYL